ncbi:MAG: hypothetical protein Tsb0018_03480 [Opitutales bacterium]
MDYNFDGKTVNVNGKKVTFDLNVDTVLEKDAILMILLYGGGEQPTCKTYHSRNIFGVNAEGEIVWQVEAPTKDPVDLYTQLTESEGKIIAGSWSCFLCHIDPQTGRILDKEFTK